MTLAGLHFDFFGDARGELDEAISEQEFNITIDEVDKLYRFIDKLFFTKINLAVIRDFKSSKAVFKGKEVTDNMQDLLYTLAVKKLFLTLKIQKLNFYF